MKAPDQLRRKAMAVLVAACYGGAHAAPVNPSVVAGQASFSQQGKVYSVTNTPNTIINWQGFSIGADEVTRFIQQSADSKVLNRITGQDPSVILGSLQSNGKVFLINPNGVLFGAGARVDVGGLVASSLNLSNADFLAGKNNFSGDAGAGKVSNQGAITTPAGGRIFLVAPAVENSGILSAPNGDVVLAAGHSVQLFDSADPNVQVVVSSPADQALNLGQIVAQGGRVGVYGALVNQRGTINANSAVRGENGKIVLKASGTTLVEAGSSTTATGANLNTGGDIRVLGTQVGVTGDAVVDASGAAGGGTVLVGGDYQGKNAAVMNARQSYVGKDAVLRADAIQSGDGGTVVVWSDQATQVFGAISARGGAGGGNGGQVETSGHYLNMLGTVDTRSAKGANGMLLLDPSDVYISLDSATATAAGMIGSASLADNLGTFLETGAVHDSLLLSSVLQTALSTTNVTVSTSNASGTGAGNIKVLSPLLWTSARSLTLQADGDIALGASINAGNGNLSMSAGGAIVQTTSPIDALTVNNLSALSAGSITLDNNGNSILGTASLVSNGGDVRVTAANLNLGASAAAGALTATASGSDLTVNGALAAQSVRLTAQRDIALQSSLITGGDFSLSTAGSITATGSVAVGGQFALQSGNWTQNSSVLPSFSATDFQLNGGTFLRVQGGSGSSASPYQLADVFGLQGVATLANANAYVLNNDIDASGTLHWTGGFRPIAAAGYNGVFDGAGHAISGLTIDRAGESYVGLFSQLASGTIENLNLQGVSVTGYSGVGGLVGLVADGGHISNVGVSGQVSGVGDTGGLAGRNGGLIAGSHSAGTVTGRGGSSGASNIGGLVGFNSHAVHDAWSAAEVRTTGQGYAGGLVGANGAGGAYTGEVLRSYATGPVGSTGEIIGGLVGDNRDGASISLSYASGSVSGGRNVGGLVGRNTGAGSISNAYATGDVGGNLDDYGIGHGNLGGLIGELSGGSVSDVYSTGVLSAPGFDAVGGLVGSKLGGSLSRGYFNLDTAGTGYDPAQALALTAAQMKQSGSYDLDLDNVWRLYDGHTLPMLKNFLTPYTVSVTGGASVTKTYDGQSAAFAGSTGALASGINGTLGFDGAVNAGTYGVGGLWSTIYDISYTGAGAQLTIQPRAVSAVVTPVADKVYDGTAGLSTGQFNTSFTNVVSGDNLALIGALAFDSKDVGSNKPLHGVDVGLKGNDFGNYVLSGVTGAGNVVKAPLVIGGLGVVTRSYNGTTAATLSGTPTVQGVLGDEVSISGSGIATFNNKNVGSAKLVTVGTSGFTLAGGDAGNYVLVSPSDLTGEITKATLTVNGMTANGRVYDATTNATVSGGTLAGVFGSDQVGLHVDSASFASKNVGVRGVTVSLSTTGADAGNYQLVVPAGLSASITPASLTVALASHEYNNATSGSFAGATVNGVLGADEVALLSAGATATYSDKNVGIAKTVTVGGTPLGLGGADGGNYVLAGVGGDITPRWMATWTASTGGLWSSAGNWQDGIAPDGANVLNATLGGSGVITYDGAAGNTTLVKLTSAPGSQLALNGGKLTLTGTIDQASNLGGGLQLAGGTLEVRGSLTAAHAVLVSGALSGVGIGSQINLAGLEQGGAVIDSAGAVTISGTGSGIAVGNVRAHSITLDAASGGAITQAAGSQLVADSLSASATGADIAITNANNHVSAFSASVSGQGNVALTNTVTSGELTLGPLSTTGNIVIDNHGGIHTAGAISGTGLVSITAHSPVTINDSVTGSDIVLAASTDITLNGGSQLHSAHSIGLTAGTNITLGGTLSVPSGGSISAVATNGSIASLSGTQINSGGAPVTLSAPNGSVSTQGSSFGSGTVPIINDGAAAAAAAAQAAAEAAAKAAADAAAKAAADAAAKAAA
ncbi:YDG domain-containing protein, partial [Duganella callida]